MRTYTEKDMIQCYKDAIENAGNTLLKKNIFISAEEYVASLTEPINNSRPLSKEVPDQMPNFDLNNNIIQAKPHPTIPDRLILESPVFSKPSSLQLKIYSYENTKPTKGIAVDVGCKGNPGKAEYRGVDIETGKVVFHVFIPGLSTNNIGEALGAVHGLKYARLNNPEDKDYKVYSDSLTAIAWVKRKRFKTNFNVTDPIQKTMIEEAEKYLRSNSNNIITKWRTDLFGEIPADFGNKRNKK